jgi:hypothetical protein
MNNDIICVSLFTDKIDTSDLPYDYGDVVVRNGKNYKVVIKLEN